jgi:hypothetical protein
MLQIKDVAKKPDDFHQVDDLKTARLNAGKVE